MKILKHNRGRKEGRTRDVARIFKGEVPRRVYRQGDHSEGTGTLVCMSEEPDTNMSREAYGAVEVVVLGRDIRHRRRKTEGQVI